MASEETLAVVHDDDLESTLRNLGVLKNIVDGSMKCPFCADVVAMDTLHSIFPDSGAIKVSCDKPSCVKALYAWMDERAKS
ncbi:MAG: hypothetical protein IH958_02345 [Chloroflexi bacterium]|nr:hypothetical protein [Chloroflexota bacterium]